MHSTRALAIGILHDCLSRLFPLRSSGVNSRDGQFLCYLLTLSIPFLSTILPLLCGTCTPLAMHGQEPVPSATHWCHRMHSCALRAPGWANARSWRGQAVVELVVELVTSCHHSKQVRLNWAALSYRKACPRRVTIFVYKPVISRRLEPKESHLWRGCGFYVGQLNYSSLLCTLWFVANAMHPYIYNTDR